MSLWSIHLCVNEAEADIQETLKFNNYFKLIMRIDHVVDLD